MMKIDINGVLGGVIRDLEEYEKGAKFFHETGFGEQIPDVDDIHCSVMSVQQRRFMVEDRLLKHLKQLRDRTMAGDYTALDDFFGLYLFEVDDPEYSRPDPAAGVAQLMADSKRLLGALADSGECKVDHDGYCQEHDFVIPADSQCPQAETAQLLREWDARVRGVVGPDLGDPHPHEDELPSVADVVDGLPKPTVILEKPGVSPNIADLVNDDDDDDGDDRPGTRIEDMERSFCAAFLQDALGIQVYDHESGGDLRAAIQANVDDGTTTWQALQDAYVTWF